MATAVKVKVMVIAASVLLTSLFVMRQSSAAFSASTDNAGNYFETGTVVLSDDDAGTVLFNVTGMLPGDVETQCLNVSYAGSQAARVKLFSGVSGTGLDAYLDLTVERSTGAAGGASHDCTGFDDANETVVFTGGTIAAFAGAHADYATGADSWDVTNGSDASYRISVTLQDDEAAQGKNATVDFTWEAQGA